MITRGHRSLAGVLLWGAVVLAAVLLRLDLARGQSLWADELFSLAMATGHSLEHPAREADASRGDYVESPRAEPPAHYARYLRHDDPPAGPARVVRAVFISDTSPPLYYLLLSLWTRVLGTSDPALRIFSIGASLSCLPFLIGAARRTGGPRAALPAVVLFAVSPVCVYYSSEGRMYALLWLWTSCWLWLSLKLRREPRPATYAAWVSAAAAGLLTHYFFAPLLGAGIGWLLMRPGRASRRALGVSTAAVALLVLPWYAWVPASLAQWRVTAGWLHVHPGANMRVAALLLPWSSVWLRPWPGLQNTIDWVNLALFSLVFALAARRLGWRLLTGSRPLLWLCFVVALLTPLVLDLVGGTYMVAVIRYSLAALPAFCLLGGMAFGALQPLLRTLLVSLFVLLALYGHRERRFTRHGEPIDALGRLLVTETRASDVVVVHSIPSGVCGVARAMIRAGSGPGVSMASWVGRLRAGWDLRELQGLARGRRRITLVKVHTVGEPAPQEGWLRENARLVFERRVQNAEVLVFEPSAGETFFPEVDD
ncbi:MAG TPA: glycosyltransferase family 39 protein [Vicinamibacteria bacterium]|nr:glycosyltransferase family 39 protein [Vicinamibacteria bacterium]